MHSSLVGWSIVATFIGLTTIAPGSVAADNPAAPDTVLVGPETETRFPPLSIPGGFQATLFACDPLVEYPSVIALGPRAGTLFVAHDYMTGLGFDIVRRDEVRLIEDTDGDGYADKSTLFAGGFNSIQGLAFYDGRTFVMHAPLLTSLEDKNDDGVADQRHDAVYGLGLPPEENSNRLHCANGVVAGHDGWLYLALGDRGCDVRRPEGDRLLVQQGGILRCRRDGSDLHVFATGLRNIYDIALDAELNVFVRDNENDGGDYMIRVCHCFFGSDHGYPYHYYERPDEGMLPLADLGRGSSAGGTSYLETNFPKDFRRSLYFCEWGRAVVRYRKTRQGSTFEPMFEIDFAVGAETDPYGFKPTDLVVDRDGSLLISDWCDDQRPKRARGRIYRISHVHAEQSEPGDTQPLKRLNSPSYHERVAAQLTLKAKGEQGSIQIKDANHSKQLNRIGRLHGVWVIAQSGSDTAIDDLFDIAKLDPEPSVRAQAVRAIGDLTDPVLRDNRFDSGRGDNHIAQRVAGLTKASDPQVMIETLIVLGRLRWPRAPGWIKEHLVDTDPALDHAATQTLRQSWNWPGVLDLLDGPPRFRKLALHAIAEQRIGYLATQLIERLQTSDNPQHRREYADLLTRIVREKKPWTYWGFRPDLRPAASINWKKTPEVVTALNNSLADPDLGVRSFVLRRMRRENVKPNLSRLATWLREESDGQRVADICESLKAEDTDKTRPLLTELVLRSKLPQANRLEALAAIINGRKLDNRAELIELARKLEEGTVLATLLREFGHRPELDVDQLLCEKLESTAPDVRAESIRSLGLRKCAAARDWVLTLMAENHLAVQQAAAESAGPLKAVDAADKLLEFSSMDDQALVRTSLISLRMLQDDRAVKPAVAALDNRSTQIAAMQYLRNFGTPALAKRAVQSAGTNPSLEYHRETMQTLSTWFQRFPDAASAIQNAVANIHGQSGQPILWRTSVPGTKHAADDLIERLTANKSFLDQMKSKTNTQIADAGDASIRFRSPADGDTILVAWSLVQVPSETNIEILASATGSMSVWVNAHRVYTRNQSGKFRPDSDRFPAKLDGKTNLIVVRVNTRNTSPRFHLRFRRRSLKSEHERLVQYALQSPGDPSRGREVFQDIKKSTCLQCHRMDTEGGTIGPDLAGIGSRFSRIHLIESILEPSRTVAPSYATIAVILNGGRVLAGVRLSQDADTIVLGDNQGKTHQIPMTDIDEIVPQTMSTMPGGLEKNLNDREFVDLLAYLESQKAERVK